MSTEDYYKKMLENDDETADDEAVAKKNFVGSMIETVENQLNDHDPEFVTEVFLSLQRKGCNRKQARTVIASALTEEMYYVLKEERAYDEKKYESNLKKRSSAMTNEISVPNVSLAIEDEINDACREIWGAITDNDEAVAAAWFLAIWPVMKEYVIHNLYRDTEAGIEKPDLTDVSVMTDYNMNFDALLPEMGTVLCNERQYENAIGFSKEVLELFSWQHSEPDSYKDDIGQALADMGKESESDAWYQSWLEEEPDNGNCVNGYAFCHQIRGDIQGALAIVEAHLPINESADSKYDNLYLRAADLYDAIGDVQKASHYRELRNAIFSSESDDVWSSGTIVKEKKIYPNDPCPCGSGKKYKKCCGKR